MRTAYLCILFCLVCGIMTAQKNVLVGSTTDSTYLELKGLDNKKVLLWDNGNAQLRNHYNILATKRDWMRFYIDSDDNQNNAEFSLYKDTLGILGYDALPDVRFHLDGGLSWITGGGNLGIGTKTPEKKLDVEGDINFSGNMYQNGVLYKNTLSINDLTDAISDVDGTNNGSSIFFGLDAGLADDATDNRNVGVGYRSMYSNTIGNNNMAMGYLSMYTNTTGHSNSAMGSSALYLNTTGQFNVAIGRNSLYNNTTKSELVAIGYRALYNNGNGATQSFHSVNNTAIGTSSLYSNSTGFENTALGWKSMYSNTFGATNVAVGSASLYSNISGDNNTATGWGSLYNNLTGDKNTGLGARALFDNITGSNNVAVGDGALENNSTGNSNIAIGCRSLYLNVDRSNIVAIGDSTLYHNGEGATSILHGTENTAVGSKALSQNTIGRENTAIGFEVLLQNTTGDGNTAVGSQALQDNTIGDNNVAVGENALGSNTTGGNNVAIGESALSANTTGSNNVAIGTAAFFFGSNLSNSTAIGFHANATNSNMVRLGNSSITSIGGYAPWSNLSDGRFKVNIQENVVGLDFISKLRPVTYQLDMDALAEFLHTPDSLRLFDSEEIKAAEIQTGFIAQEVEIAASEAGYIFHGVDAPKNEKSHYGLRYAEFVVPLVKAVQELEQKNSELTTLLSQSNEAIKNLESRITLLEELIHQKK